MVEDKDPQHAHLSNWPYLKIKNMLPMPVLY